VYLVSPEVAAFSAIKGFVTDVEDFYDVDLNIHIPKKFTVNDNMIISPSEDGSNVEVVRGPNIKSFPKNVAMANETKGKVLIKVEDDITTDAIMPSNANLLPYRSNIPYLSEYCFSLVDRDFPKKARENNGGIIVAGKNYGQGSSREHAALAPLYLGIKAVLAKSFARIHKSNLINNGIIPLSFINESDYDDVDPMDEIVIENLLKQIENKKVSVKNETKNKYYEMELTISPRQIDMLKFGGLLNYMSLKKA
jgi:aconitate hydratase